MHARKKAKASSEDGRASPPGGKETVVSKTGRHRNLAQGGVKNHKLGSKWEESVLDKLRGALVKARLALREKREKKKEQYLRSTLARLRKIADAGRQPEEDEEVPPMSPPPIKRGRGRPPKTGKSQQVLAAAVVTERTTKIVLKKATTTSERSQADESDLNEPIPSVTKVKRGRKPKSLITTADFDEADVPQLRAELERKEEVKNKWRNALQIARSARQRKRERRKEQARKAAMTRLRRSQDNEAVRDNIAQMGFSLRRPSLEELRDFARKSRCQVCDTQTLSNPVESRWIDNFGGSFLV